MVAPTQQPEPEADLYDIADEPAPAKKPIKAPAMAVAAPGANGASAGVAGPASTASRPKAVSPLLAYQRSNKQREEEEEKRKHRSDFENQLGGELWRELYLPAAMVIVGLGLNMLLFMHSAGGWVSPKTILVPLSLTLLFNLVLSFIAILMVAKAFEISFGHPATAVLKMSACILLPTALAGFAGNWVGGDSFFVNFMTRATLMFPLTLVFVMLFFQLAMEECFWVVTVIYLITDWVTKFIIAAMLTTGVGASSSSAILGVADVETAEQVQLPKSKSPWVQEQIKSGVTKEAFSWMSQGDRTIGANGPDHAVLTPDQSMQLLQAIRAAGATDLQLSDHYPYRAYTLYIGMPANPAARSKLILACETLADQCSASLDEVLEADTYLIMSWYRGREQVGMPVSPTGGYK